MQRLAPVVHRTPMTESTTFDTMTGAHLHFKLENLQRTGSFKLRGAYNKVSHLSVQQAERGIITASAGNHAQGVALSAARRNIRARIYMPETTPKPKVQATAAYGAEVVLAGRSYQDSYEAALRDQQASGATFVHAFDDVQVMAGQGTIAVEMLEQCPQLQTVVVPVGGGGLASGVATCVKSVRPDIRVIGVQSDRAPAMYNRFHHYAGNRDRKFTGGIAEGILVRKPGEQTFPILHRYLDDIVTVTDQDVAGAMLLLLERSKLLVEGAGAAALAAVLSGRIQVRGRHVGLIVSGGNADPDRIPLLNQLVSGSMEKYGT
ncbi:threonine ammonia-lyase [Sporolactobacillus vineae]|uniref:threonine ammonia-lyase n=1 Tax=Sporolactobacillus vineae TaxID=444463 RepID=UPI0002888471|nr:threonine ammonia-lyase [Sporolactobacillus vineae]